MNAIRACVWGVCTVLILGAAHVRADAPPRSGEGEFRHLLEQGEAFYAEGHGAYVVIKECMNLVGRPGGWPRRPHLRIDEAGRGRLAATLRDMELLEA